MIRSTKMNERRRGMEANGMVMQIGSVCCIPKNSGVLAYPEEGGAAPPQNL
jgi:hypothetical protein